MGSYLSDRSYELFAPANASILYPYEADTVLPLAYGALITGAHVLFLSIATLWIRRWRGLRAYAFQWLLFIVALTASVLAFVGIGYAYRHLSGHNEASIYARDLPVGLCLFGVFGATIVITVGIRAYYARKQPRKA